MICLSLHAEVLWFGSVGVSLPSAGRRHCQAREGVRQSLSSLLSWERENREQNLGIIIKVGKVKLIENDMHLLNIQGN